MPTLPKSHDVDLEPATASSNDGRGERETPQRKVVAAEGEGEGDAPWRLAGGNEIGGVVENNGDNKTKLEKRESNVSDCSVEIVDLEAGLTEHESKLHFAKSERDCRICQLSMDATNHDSGIPIELGCSCKDDLAAAHKQCAEAWFKIKGNKTCEICGSIAQNVSVATESSESVEQWNESNDAAAVPAPHSESRNFWHGHRFLNFLLACMVFAFVVSWLFHFNIPS